MTFEHRSLVESIMHEVRNDILEGRLSPGDRVTEESLSKKYNVSRSPVREAFRLLESQGILVHESRKGMTVTSLTAEEAVEIYQIRAALEGLAAYLSVNRQNPETLSRLKDLHQDMIEAARTGDFSAYMALNNDFHKTLNEGAGNERLLKVLEMFENQIVRYRFEVLSLPGRLDNSIKSHEVVIDSFEKGDAAEAERLRKEAIFSQIPILLKKINKEGE